MACSLEYSFPHNTSLFPAHTGVHTCCYVESSPPPRPGNFTCLPADLLITNRSFVFMFRKIFWFEFTSFEFTSFETLYYCFVIKTSLKHRFFSKIFIKYLVLAWYVYLALRRCIIIWKSEMQTKSCHPLAGCFREACLRTRLAALWTALAPRATVGG